MRICNTAKTALTIKIPLTTPKTTPKSLSKLDKPAFFTSELIVLATKPKAIKVTIKRTMLAITFLVKSSFEKVIYSDNCG